MNIQNIKDYESIYNDTIGYLYGPIRDESFDENLINDNNIHFPNILHICERDDMTIYDTYTIDPDGCEDADDAFSLFSKNDKLMLAIHIADPTEHININSLLWYDILERGITKYPSNNKPIHMLPKQIVDQCSLMDNDSGNIKNTISILTEIDQESLLPIGLVKIIFGKIKLDKTLSLSYRSACDIINDNTIITSTEPMKTHKDILKICLQISNGLHKKRQKKTIGTTLSDITMSQIKYINGIPELYIPTSTERKFQNMIAEFAIFANSFVGEYLNINLNGNGIFKVCDAQEWLTTIYPGITGRELLNEIILNGICAEYTSTSASHDLVGIPSYCHFTSPLRRMSDCVCHYLIKYLFLLNKGKSKITNPFDEDTLKMYSNICQIETKKNKKIQFNDNKFRLIQIMSMMVSSNVYSKKIKLTYYKSNLHACRFLNIVICKLNDFDIYISYTIKIKNLNNILFEFNSTETIEISTVNCNTIHDEGTFPELDKILLHQIK
jgi:exoribonuclease R